MADLAAEIRRLVKPGQLDTALTDKTGHKSLPRSRRRSRLRSRRGSGVSRRSRVNRTGELDTLIRTSPVRPGIRLGRVVVDDSDVLDIHGERNFAVICLATGPFDRTLRIGWVAAGPDTQTNVHGGLGVSGSGFGVVEG